MATQQSALDGMGGTPADAVLLETKLTPPPVREEHVRRQHALDRLRQSTPRRLTLVAAPPGFGKSTLLAGWAADRSNAVAWLSLDETDNDPARFFTYVVAALRRLEPGLGARALAALKTPGASLVDVVLPPFLNDLARLQRDLALVIEDYHVVADPEVHAAVAYLVERAPSSLRVVVSTREDPPLPLGRLRARGELTEIRADDLRFTEDETGAFLTESLGLTLSRDDVARLHARTEGWPAALYLAALSLLGRSDASAAIERFAGDDRYVVDYLTSEVLARQTPELRAFLLRTSILQRFSGPLCDAVAGTQDSAARLAELERSNLLVVPLDTRREWYRYHHLFGDVLRHELEATEGPAIPILHRRASAWYRDAGLIVDAARHAIAGGDLPAVAELVGRHYALFVDQGQLATVIGWLDAIPERAVAEDWLLGFAGAVVFANAGRVDEAERWLGLAEGAPHGAREGQDPDALLGALAATLRLLRGDVAGTVAHGRRSLAAGSADAPWMFAPLMVLASGLWWSGETAEAVSILEAAIRTARRERSPVDLVYALGVRAAVALDEQDETTAADRAREAIEEIGRAGLEDHAWTAMAQIVHGALLGRAGDPAAASVAIERGLALGERLHAWQVTVYASLALAELRQRQRDPTAARRLLAHARDILETLPDPGDGFDRLERTEKSLKLRATRRASSTPGPFWELSPREVDVLRLLPSALSQREIAAELYVSFNTVRTHTRVIFSKLGVASRSDAVARARDLGLI